ncbi:GatB/YqeY domain-containing protein [Ghiorsea bivora]|uniref:GatB/YqeY domain-containing protein n=1 Tax=Ghiorsea bivora TaxID=1485545 RepID=UPI00056ECAF1|nr:GatB/YqeY domain-containing protein [Ghiorsea bivora]
MLIQQITDDMKTAMKAKDKVALGVIRMLRAAIKDKEIELGITLENTETLAVIGKLIKQRKDSASQYREADRPELAEKEEAEIKVLEVYLPEQMNDAEIKQLVADAVAEAGATSMKDMGKVMGIVRPKAQGKADMSKVSAEVKAALQ